MRRDSLLQWIEQAEARKVADAAFLEQMTMTSAECEARRRPAPPPRQPRRLWPMWRRVRSLRPANYIC